MLSLIVENYKGGLEDSCMPSENKGKYITEQDLGDIILCDPITSRGLEALQQLDLNNDVSEDYFFDNIYITPKYYAEPLANKSNDESIFHYTYSVSDERFNEMKMKLEYFDEKFTSDAQNQSPLHIIGTTGNGKSIEAYFKIRNPKKGNEKIKCNRIFYNLEKSITELTYGFTYSLKKEHKGNALWLTCMVLLDELYKLIEKNYINILSITKNHKKYFIEHNSADDLEKKLFFCIENYKPNCQDTVRQLFQTMTELIDNNDAGQSIENILKITMNVMYCINPENKNYIVLDNLEHYIKLSSQNILIHNSTLSGIYTAARNVTGNLTNIYNRISLYESWRAFKIIIVLRRTSGHLLVQSDAQYANKLLGMGNDYTGHFDIWRIWEKKKQFVWEKFLKGKYDSKQSSDIIWIIDDMMEDAPSTLGRSYQELISPLMNSGIRRNGRTQAHTTMDVYKILCKNNGYYINFDIYIKLLSDVKGEKTAIRYIYRRALLEIHYKWMIISLEAQQRFEKLFLGKLSDEQNTFITDLHGNSIKKREVSWDGINKNNTTLVRRILSYLSNYIDNSPVEIKNGCNFRTWMFETKSLYDLIAGIFLNPNDNMTKKLNNTDHYLPLAMVLTSLGNMSYSATKAAPLVILDIDDPRINSINNSEKEIADILKEIWEAGENESKSNGRYNCANYGVRLTEAGNIFLCDIQPSFSFFAALYCSEEVPLFFLTDFNRIKFVIDSVYNAAEQLCSIYESAASSFCGSNNTIFKGNYLPKHSNNYITFRCRVKDMHSNHLELYKDFIDKNADTLNLTDYKSDLKKYIEKIISRYRKWKTGKESVNCF